MLDAVDDLTLLPGDVKLKSTLRGDTCAKRKARQLSLLPGTACVVWLPSFLKAGISSRVQFAVRRWSATPAAGVAESHVIFAWLATKRRLRHLSLLVANVLFAAAFAGACCAARSSLPEAPLGSAFCSVYCMPFQPSCH
jgi:hypothetical protein